MWSSSLAKSTLTLKDSVAGWGESNKCAVIIIIKTITIIIIIVIIVVIIIIVIIMKLIRRRHLSGWGWTPITLHCSRRESRGVLRTCVLKKGDFSTLLTYFFKCYLIDIPLWEAYISDPYWSLIQAQLPTSP